MYYWHVSDLLQVPLFPTSSKDNAELTVQVHCPHLSPSGGGKCVNVPCNDVYFDDKALFDHSRAETFMCGH